jgi:hypothetical protein
MLQVGQNPDEQIHLYPMHPNVQMLTFWIAKFGVPTVMLLKMQAFCNVTLPLGK